MTNRISQKKSVYKTTNHLIGNKKNPPYQQVQHRQLRDPRTEIIGKKGTGSSQLGNCDDRTISKKSERNKIWITSNRL